VVEEEHVSIRLGNDIGITLGTCRRETIGAVLGGVVGGVIGNQAGDESNKAVTTVAGAVLGVLVGKSIGRQMDQKDQQCTGQVLERAVDGDSVRWVNEAGVTFNITPLETFDKGGLFCRKYQTVSTQAGKPLTAQQSACRQKDGTWKPG
jgi:surface antigen